MEASYFHILAIIGYFLSMLGIGWYSYIKTSSRNKESYMLAGRSLGPVVTALSAGASDMSGWLLMGLPGAMYSIGLSSIWIAVGLTIGAYLNYIVVAPKLRLRSGENNNITILEFLSSAVNDKKHTLSLIGGTIILVFFTLYVSAGIVASGAFFESVFNMPYSSSITLITVAVVLYTCFGGFMGVSLTDAMQGAIMVLALLIVPILTIVKSGGLSQISTQIVDCNPNVLSLFKGTSTLSLIGFIAWGLGYFGQPHILVRFMSIQSAAQLPVARRIGISWMVFCVLGALSIGLVGLSYVTKNGLTLDNPETIFIFLVNIVFHPFVAGVFLSAILAAIMSTVSSQLLVTSTTIANDLCKVWLKKELSDKQAVTLGRISVALIAFISLAVASTRSNTILNLVGYAWAGFGSTFGPCMLLALHWKSVTKEGMIAGLIVGAVTVLIWISIPVLRNTLYEMVPGFACSTVAITLVSLMTNKRRRAPCA